jgi:tetraacyldisaccharide 4'-kinase
LRDDPKSLKRADLIVIHQADNLNKLEEVSKQIQEYSSAPIVGTSVHVKAVQDFRTKKQLALAQTKAAVFCSIGRPSSFIKTVEELDCQIVDQLNLPDHSSLDIPKIMAFAEKAKDFGAEYLLCTEKDSVKLSSNLVMPIPLAIVQTEIQMMSGKSLFQQLISKINKLDGQL